MNFCVHLQYNLPDIGAKNVLKFVENMEHIFFPLGPTVFEMQVALRVHCRTNDELSVGLNADLSTVACK